MVKEKLGLGFRICLANMVLVFLDTAARSRDNGLEFRMDRTI